MKKVLFYIVCFFAFHRASAQQVEQYSMQMLNLAQYNPAYTGLQESIEVTGVLRRQWTSFPGSPSASVLNMNMPLYIAGGGIGLTFKNLKIGAQQNTAFGLAYSYHLLLGNALLSGGVNAQYSQFRLDGSLIRTPDGNYTEPGFINHNDDQLLTQLTTIDIPHISLGLVYRNNRLNAGIAVLNLNEPLGKNDSISFTYHRHLLLNAGATFDLSENISFEPSLIIRSDFIKTQTELAALFQYNDNITLGASFRGYDSKTIDAVSVITGVRLNSYLSLYYSYDIGLSGLRTSHSGSHEVMLNYSLSKTIGKGKPPVIIYNPRTW